MLKRGHQHGRFHLSLSAAVAFLAHQYKVYTTCQPASKKS